ncbi:MAG: thioredoxin [Bacteroidales bacterium]
MNGTTQHLTKAEFLEKVYNFETNPNEWKFKGERPAIVDFYAQWCAPCKSVAPVLEDLAKEYEGKLDIYKVDVDAENELSSAFGIRSIPTMLFIPKEGQPQMSQGALPKASLKEAINDLIK